MDKESVGREVGLGNNVNEATQVVAKGKRTKRLRLLAPGSGVMTSSCSSSAISGDGDYGSFSSTTTTTTFEEEQDMANCLILLAQGDSHQKPPRGGGEKSTSTKVGFFIYECKTCNRSFPSFQALGGHRASHKRPKLMAEPPPPFPPQVVTNFYPFEEEEVKSGPQAQAPAQAPAQSHKANKAKIHECSICGSEFTSGQALGGHMRRHRASASASAQPATSNCLNNKDATVTVTVEVKPRNILQLDLNLPAPEEDLRDSKFQFTAPALVDCHY